MAKVLVVDDHASNRELICTLLKYAGHSSIEAVDGHHALQQACAERPDLVVCDILMPTMDGYEFVRQLRVDPAIAHTEVVFCTATFLERETQSLARACGVERVLIKPCEPEEILRVIEDALQHATLPVPLADDLQFDREHLRIVTDKLAFKVDELERANLRLAALTELNLQLASERDPHRLLDQLCRGARDLLGARFAVLLAFDKADARSMHLATWGLSAEQVARLGQPAFDAGVFGRVMASRRATRLKNPLEAELPAGLAPVTSALVAPVVSLQRTYGWILLVDKLGAAAFSEDDERILAIHAAQAGRIYENGSLYAELQAVNETLEQRVKQRTSELHEIIEGLESFNRSVSHDLRGPLGGIAGAARMARDFMAHDNSAGAQRLLEAIETQAEVSGKVVDALLALARTSDATLRTQRVDMNALVLEVIESMQQTRPGDALPLSVGPLPSVDADPGLARQVFINLIGNALKFAAGAQAPRVEIGADVSFGEPVFFVRDNGVGFNAQSAQRLFKPFHRMHGPQFSGSGVGLSIVKRIVDRHGGTIRAESTPGAGATFFFTFGAGSPAPA
jgi:signal transduction histidine kinase